MHGGSTSPGVATLALHGVAPLQPRCSSARIMHAGSRRRTMSISVSAGRRASVVAGLETVPPASLVFSSVGITTTASAATPPPAPGGGGGVPPVEQDQHQQPASRAETKTLLSDVAGVARSGELVAVMGPSGSGKTTLLTALAGGSVSGGRGQVSVSGQMKLNGETRAMGSLVSARLASFVSQEDCLLLTLTVHETLLYAAELQLPSSPSAARIMRVGEVLRDLRLSHRADDLVRNLSGGEKRRLSIGCDGLLCAPLLMFLDEPTSGLSSTDAMEVVKCLKCLARDSDYTIVCTIHQPPAEIFALFTRVILLSGGQLVYSGRRRHLPAFFKESGCDIGGDQNASLLARQGEIENLVNVADRLMDWITVPAHAAALSVAFRKSDFHCNLLAEVQRKIDPRQMVLNANASEVEAVDASGAPISRSFAAQVSILCRREGVSLWRSFGAFQLAVIAALMNCVLFGAVFWQLPDTAGAVRDRLNAVSNLIDMSSLIEPSWAQAYLENRARMRRDIATGTVSVAAHTVVWLMLTVMRCLALNAVTMTVAWFSVGYAVLGAADYALIFFVVFMSTMILHSLLLLLTLDVRTLDVAMGTMGVFYLFWWQFRGFFVNPSDYNPILRWLIQANPSRYSFETISFVIFAHQEFRCENEQQNGTIQKGHSLEQMCPMPGNVIIAQNSFEDRPERNCALLLVWMVSLFVLIHVKTARWKSKNSIGSLPLGFTVSDAIQRSPTHVHLGADNPNDLSADKTNQQEPAPNKKLKDLKSVQLADRTLSSQDSVSISADLVDEVDKFLHRPVTLSFKDVRVIGDNRLIVHSASGQVCPGELLAVMGPSGAGKTSLLKALIGSADCDVSGTVSLNGQHLRKPLQSRQAAFVAQHDRFFEELTVNELLYYSAELQLGHAPAHVRAVRIDDVLSGLRLKHCADSAVSTLSGGERRRVSLGCHGLLTPARLLILDEPTTGLSSTDALELMRVLSDLCVKFQFAVVLTIHQPRQQIFELLDRVILLGSGKVVFSGPRREIESYFAGAGQPLPAGKGTVDAIMDIASDSSKSRAVSAYFLASHMPTVSLASTGETTVCTADTKSVSGAFFFAHRCGDFRAFNWLCLLLWLPFGVILALVRMVMSLLVLVLLLVVPACASRDSHSNKGCSTQHLALGMFRLMFMRVSVSNPPDSKVGDAKILVSNHISEWDFVALASCFSVRVVAMDHLQHVPIVGRLLTKANNPVYITQMGNAQSAMASADQCSSEDVAAHKEEQRQKVKSAVEKAVSEQDQPSLLIFPEGVLTNGRHTVLQYQKFVFSLGAAVQPVAIRREPGCWLPMHADTLKASALTNVLWPYFLPRAHYRIEVLPQMAPTEGESDIDFAARVQQATANALGLTASQFGNRDKNQWVKRLNQWVKGLPVASCTPCGLRQASVDQFDSMGGSPLLQLFKRSVKQELWTITCRTLKIQSRNKNSAGIYIFNVLACGFLQMVLYWRVDQIAENTQSIFGAYQTTAMTYVLLTLSTCFHHNDAFKVQTPDIGAGRYSLASVLLADLFVGTVRMALVGCIFTPLVYFGTGFSQGHSFSHVFDFLLPMVAMGCFADALAIFLLFASFSESFMGSFTGQCLGTFSLFSGFFIKVSNTPPSLVWLHHVNPIRAGAEFFLAAHFGGRVLQCGNVAPADRTVPCPMPGDAALAAIDYEVDNDVKNVRAASYYLVLYPAVYTLSELDKLFATDLYLGWRAPFVASSRILLLSVAHASTAVNQAKPVQAPENDCLCRPVTGEFNCVTDFLIVVARMPSTDTLWLLVAQTG
jgi:ABC-type multidrug transport system ATPase subunit/1-acyl-sn-glycerol-3-phosphate acyltransferase